MLFRSVGRNKGVRCSAPSTCGFLPRQNEPGDPDAYMLFEDGSHVLTAAPLWIHALPHLFVNLAGRDWLVPMMFPPNVE
jgi:hypothetical protein